MSEITASALTPTVDLTADVAAALNTARTLAARGVPIFLAAPARDQGGAWNPHGGQGGTGYWLPHDWQRTRPDPSVVDAWRPGMAIAAVMGHGIDAIDVDPRNGGDLAAIDGALPRVYGAQLTPSGGVHAFIASLGVGTAHGRAGTPLAGIDIQAGHEGVGHGFVFLAPTTKVSKVTGQPVAYRWGHPIDPAALGALGMDVTGAALRELLGSTHNGAHVDGVGGVDPASFLAMTPWQRFEAGTAFDQGRHNGVIRLVAALHGRGGWRLEDARRYLDAVVWPEIDQAQAGHAYSYDEFVADVEDEWARLDAKVISEQAADVPGLPALTTNSPAPTRLHGTLLSVEALKGDPPPTPPYILDGLLRTGELAALVSEAKAGKSLLTLDRVLSAVVAGYRVLYLDAENGYNDIHTRVHQLGYGDDDLTGLLYSSFPSLALDTIAGAQELLTFVATLAAEGGKVDAVVLDTASRFLGGSENDAEPWLAMYRLALLPLKREGIAVLRLDHLGKDPTKGARGSSAKSGDVDTVWELRKDHETASATRLRLECTMQRAGTHERETILVRQSVHGVLGHHRVGDLPEGAVMPVADPGSEVDDAIRRIIGALDALDAPINTGRGSAKRLLGARFTVANQVWEAAVRQRKQRGERDFADTGPAPDLPRDLPPTPENLPGSGETCPQDQQQLPGAGRGSLVVSAGQAAPGRLGADEPRPAPSTAQPLGVAARRPEVDLEGSGRVVPSDEPIGNESSASTAPPATAPVKITKAEQKRRERAQAFADAAGPTHALPALVGRDGTVHSVSRDDVYAAMAVELAYTDGALTVDVETTGYPLGHEHYRLRTIQLGGSRIAVVLDANDPAQCQIAADLLAQATRLHAHSATADLAPLAHAGLIDYDEAWSRMHDTVLPAKLADPASTGSDPGLKKLSDAMLGEHAVSPAAEAARSELFKRGRWLTETDPTTPVERSGWAQVDSGCHTMIVYAASDVLDDAELAQQLPAPDPGVLERERIAQRMTARVALRGLRLDGEHAAHLTEQHTAEREEAATRVRAFDVDNPGSDAQVAVRLADLGADLPRTKPSKRFPMGQLSVAGDVLQGLTRAPGEAAPLATAVLEYRHHAKLLAAFLEPYSALATRGDGRIRPTVYTLQASTGRMSCVRPNLQQVPRTGGVRACITADPGYLLISADFAAVELRVAAALSQDQSLMQFIADEDAGLSDGLHWAIARQVWGSEATKAQRYQAKRIVFGRLYGGGTPTLAAQAGCTLEQAQSAVDVLDDLAPGLAAWSAMIRQSVEQGATRFTAYSGRVIHLDKAWPHKGPNYAIQGTARELTVDGLIRWQDTPWGDATILPVHDEIVAMVPQDDAEDATRALVACMSSQLHGVTIKAEASEPSFAWADAA